MTIVANRATSAPVATGTASTVRRRQLRGPLVMGPLGLSIGITLILVFTSSATETRLGAPLYWSWLLTGLQVLALWAAGAEHRWGWLLGASVQPPWIVYAVLFGVLSMDQAYQAIDWRTVIFKEKTDGMVYSLYANENTGRPDRSSGIHSRMCHLRRRPDL